MASTAYTSATLTAGSGSDALVLRISQDAYRGSAQYTVKVDGKQVGGTFTASALRSSGQSDTLTLKGDWGPGEHRVEVAFTNDLYGGSATADRNLHVDAATYNGQALQGAAATLYDAGSASFGFTEAAPTTPTQPTAPAAGTPVTLSAGSGSDSLVLKVSQDAYQGSAEYQVLVDGKQVGGTFTASALKSSGQSDTLTLKGDWAAGVHRVEVKFLNDAWDGTPATDRNLYVDGGAYNGKALDGVAAALNSAGIKAFAFTEAAPSQDTLTVFLSGDAWNGNAQARLTVNGVEVGGLLDVAAVHGKDDVSAFTVTGRFGAAPTVGLSFVNDDYGGSAGADRNLYLGGFEYNGVEHLGMKATLGWNQTLDFTLSAAPAPALRAADLGGFLGVCAHVDFFDTAYGLPDGSGPDTQLILSSLDYLGVRNVRVGVPTPETLPAFTALAEAGYKFNVLMPSTSSDAMLKEQLAAIHPIAGSVVSIEGPNEINLTRDFSWNGQAGDEAGRAYQHALYAAVKADPKLAGADVYGLTLAGVGEDKYRAFGDMSPDVDAGNMHVYFMDGLAPASTLRYASNLSAINAPGEPMAITETNYTSAPGIKGSVSEAVQAKYDLDLVMDAMQAGVEALYFYELLDERADPDQTNNEDHFGLFRADGSPKPAATALHNLTTILADTSPDAATFETGSLGYNVSGLPHSGNTMLFEKASGEYDIVIWAEPELWNVDTQTEVPATERAVTLDFASEQANVAVFDPMLGTGPIATYAHVSSISLSVVDHPLVVQVGGPVWA